MFKHAPSEVFRPDELLPKSENDFYMVSMQVSSAEEDITDPPDLNVRLADFGTGEHTLFNQGSQPF